VALHTQGLAGFRGERVEPGDDQVQVGEAVLLAGRPRN